MRRDLAELYVKLESFSDAVRELEEVIQVLEAQGSGPQAAGPSMGAAAVKTDKMKVEAYKRLAHVHLQ